MWHKISVASTPYAHTFPKEAKFLKVFLWIFQVVYDMQILTRMCESR